MNRSFDVLPPMKVMLRALIFFLLLPLGALATPEVERFLANPRFKRAEIAFDGTSRTYTGGLEDFGFYFISQPQGTNGGAFIAGLHGDTAWLVAGDIGFVAKTNEFGATDPFSKAQIDNFKAWQMSWGNDLTNIATLFLTAAVPGSIRINGDRFQAVNRVNGKPFSGSVLRDGSRIDGFSYSANGFTNLLTFTYDPKAPVALPVRIRKDYRGPESGSLTVLVTKWDLSPTDPEEGFFPSSVVGELKLSQFSVVTNGLTMSLNQKGEFETVVLARIESPLKGIILALAATAFLVAIWFCRPGKRKTTT